MMKTNETISSIQLFSNRYYFRNPFACLLAKYVAGGLFDKRNEGSFCTWGFRFTRITVENALLCFTAPNKKSNSVTPKMTFEFAFAAQQDNFQQGVFTQKGPKRVWKLLPSVSGS